MEEMKTLSKKINEQNHKAKIRSDYLHQHLKTEIEGINGDCDFK
jgi:hypothetical protein